MKKKIAYVTLMTGLALSPLMFVTGCAVTQGRETAGAYAKDKEIQARVKAKLYKDPIVKGTQIEVKSLNGVVQLSGFVDNQEAKQRAGELASSTPGVTQVYNNILLPTGR